MDPDTGIVRVPTIWIGHDIGQAINPALVMGQVEGGVYMGLGEALMEEMAYREKLGLVHKWPSMLEYKSPTTMEMCDVITYLIEDPDPNGPFGAKEAGQGPLNPVMPAIANAIYDAVGVRIDEVPMSPPKVLKAIQAKAKGKDPRFGPTGTPAVPWPERTYVRTPAQGGNGKDWTDSRRCRQPGRARRPRPVLTTIATITTRRTCGSMLRLPPHETSFPDLDPRGRRRARRRPAPPARTWPGGPISIPT